MIEELLLRVRQTGPDSHVLVRSNSPTELMTERGEHKTFVVRPDLREVLYVVEMMMRVDEDPAVLPLLQQSIEPSTVGHMSNERRVTRSKSIWLVEGFPGGATAFGQIRLRVRQPVAIGSLLANDTRRLRTRLGQVAGTLQKRGKGVYHCEWAWDGRQLWLVQADAVSTSQPETTADAYLRNPPKPPQAFSPLDVGLLHFRKARAGQWRKLARPLRFAELGMPTADVFLLTGDRWVGSTESQQELLQRDLKAMCTRPVVVRCDIAGSHEGEDILLPTSPPSEDPEKLLSFMTETASWFADQGTARDGWAFLLSQLQPACASSMAYASPQSEVVQVDALWGFPDGLQCFPHDSYTFNTRTRTIRTRIRYKGYCIVPSEGAWCSSPVNPPLDWAQVLNAEEVAVVADWGSTLATSLGRAVELMALARMSGTRGRAGCLPWHYTDWALPKQMKAPSPLLNPRLTSLVTSDEDLRALEERGLPQSCLGISLCPDSRHLRNADFLHRVARLATQKAVPVFFEGSTLGHSFYILAHDGAAVISVGEEVDPTEVTKHRKLVRDEIPAIVRRAGGVARVRTLSRTEARVLLSQKLVEEALEVWNSHGQAVVGELADVLEVVDALRQEAGLSARDLEDAQARKRSERGGFGRLIFLEETARGTMGPHSDDDGALPLWDDAPAENTPTRRSETVGGHLRLEPATDRGELLRLRLPLVPPVEHGEPTRSIHSRAGDYDIVARYEGSSLMVSLRRPSPQDSSAQFDLFPDVA